MKGLPSKVIDAIGALKKRTLAGMDNIYSEHFKLAYDKVAVNLSLIFNTMVIHGYIPQMVMDTILIPMVKDKKGDVTDGDNYGPIAITCISSKILELFRLRD